MATLVLEDMQATPEYPQRDPWEMARHFFDNNITQWTISGLGEEVAVELGYGGKSTWWTDDTKRKVDHGVLRRIREHMGRFKGSPGVEEARNAIWKYLANGQLDEEELRFMNWLFDKMNDDSLGTFLRELRRGIQEKIENVLYRLRTMA